MLYQHDCGRCRGSGTADDSDLYVCGDRFIVRYGDHGYTWTPIAEAASSDNQLMQLALMLNQARVSAAMTARWATIQVDRDHLERNPQAKEAIMR